MKIMKFRMGRLFCTHCCYDVMQSHRVDEDKNLLHFYTKCNHIKSEQFYIFLM